MTIKQLTEKEKQDKVVGKNISDVFRKYDEEYFRNRYGVPSIIVDHVHYVDHIERILGTIVQCWRPQTTYPSVEGMDEHYTLSVVARICEVISHIEADAIKKIIKHYRHIERRVPQELTEQLAYRMWECDIYKKDHLHYYYTAEKELRRIVNEQSLRALIKDILQTDEKHMDEVVISLL